MIFLITDWEMSDTDILAGFCRENSSRTALLTISVKISGDSSYLRFSATYKMKSQNYVKYKLSRWDNFLHF